jgi:hypothetical protein
MKYGSVVYKACLNLILWFMRACKHYSAVYETKMKHDSAVCMASGTGSCSAFDPMKYDSSLYETPVELDPAGYGCMRLQ